MSHPSPRVNLEETSSADARRVLATEKANRRPPCLQPINDNYSSLFKLGSTVPVKFADHHTGGQHQLCYRPKLKPPQKPPCIDNRGDVDDAEEGA